MSSINDLVNEQMINRTRIAQLQEEIDIQRAGLQQLSKQLFESQQEVGRLQKVTEAAKIIDWDYKSGNLIRYRNIEILHQALADLESEEQDASR